MISRHALVPALTAAVVLVLAIVLPFAGCGLPLQGLTGAEDAGTPCAADSQCDDSNPCTADACQGGACEHIAQADGPAPSTAQVSFNCQVILCVTGLPEVQNDDEDYQADSEDCTIDGCNKGRRIIRPRSTTPPARWAERAFARAEPARSSARTTAGATTRTLAPRTAAISPKAPARSSRSTARTRRA